jgi:hypothetical protein
VQERQRKVTTKDLKNWDLIESFVKELSAVASKNQLHPTFSDPRRTLDYATYLSLFLFGLFNPVVKSMRQLCAITELDKVRNTLSCGNVSLGSFSEAQAVIDPDLLKQVFERLVDKMPKNPKVDDRLKSMELMAQDGSIWPALPRMIWADYGVGKKGVAKGVRLHLRYNIVKNCPSDALIREGKWHEGKGLEEMHLPGQTTVGDRLYGGNYKSFKMIDEARGFFVFRISNKAVINEVENIPVTEAEAKAGIIRHAWVQLGATKQIRSMRVRLVEVRRDGQHLLLVTNHSVEELSAEMVSLVYRNRWKIELYFSWIKCILESRHFFAESPEGAAIQIYLALIASLIIQLFTGERPNKRVMEFLQYYFMGWMSSEELARLVLKYIAKGKAAKKQ